MVLLAKTHPGNPVIREIVRQITACRRTCRCPRRCKRMIAEHHHLALVRDSGGKVAGMITQEDIFEELVGDIQDEFDRLPRHINPRRASAGRRRRRARSAQIREAVAAARTSAASCRPVPRSTTGSITAAKCPCAAATWSWSIASGARSAKSAAGVSPKLVLDPWEAPTRAQSGNRTGTSQMTNDQAPRTKQIPNSYDRKLCWCFTAALVIGIWSLVVICDLMLRHWTFFFMAEMFILIPGRTSKQGVGISEGKFKAGYQSETRTLQIAPQDMQRLGLKDNDRVRLKSESGQIEVAVTTAKGDELPPGLLIHRLRRSIQPPDGRRNPRQRHAHEQGDRCRVGDH